MPFTSSGTRSGPASRHVMFLLLCTLPAALSTFSHRLSAARTCFCLHMDKHSTRRLRHFSLRRTATPPPQTQSTPSQLMDSGRDCTYRDVPVSASACTASTASFFAFLGTRLPPAHCFLTLRLRSIFLLSHLNLWNRTDPRLAPLFCDYKLSFFCATILFTCHCGALKITCRGNTVTTPACLVPQQS